MIKCIQNLIKFRPFILKILSKNQFLTSIKAITLHPLVQSGQNSNSVQTCWVSSLPEKLKKIQSKMLALECSQQFSDVQGHITLELVVVSGRNLNSFKLSCMSLLPAKMRLIQSKMKELECSQDSSFIHLRGFNGRTDAGSTPIL